MREVRSTRSFDKFIPVESNRDITPAHSTKLAKSISRTGGNIQPIIVDRNLRVLDGQHRLDACRSLDIPVSYLVTETNLPGVELMIELNINSRNWTLGDYLQHWIDVGGACSDNYSVIRHVADSYGFGVEPTLVLCGSCARVVRAGEEIQLPPRLHITARAVSDFATEYLRVSHSGLRSLPAAKAVMDLESRLDIRAEVDPLCKSKWDYQEAINKIYQILPEDGVSCTTKTLRILLSEAFDFKKLKANKLAL